MGVRCGADSPYERCRSCFLPARGAQTVKLDNMRDDLEPMFPGEFLFDFTEETDLFIDEVVILDDAPARCANQVMMMPRFFRIFRELVPTAPVAEVLLHHNAHLFEQVEGSIDRGQSHVGVHFVNPEEDLLGRKVLDGASQNIDDDATGFGNAQPMYLELYAQGFGVLGIHRVLIDNGYH